MCSHLQDVHDRALLYYRLLQHSTSIAEKVVNPPKQAVSVFADTQSSEIKDRIFDEFNSLSVVYQKVFIVCNLNYIVTSPGKDFFGNISALSQQVNIIKL